MTILRVGLAIRAYGGTKENRPGIVLRSFQVEGVWWSFVAFGTSKEPPVDTHPPPLLIDRSHLAFTPLGLDTPTWFKANMGGRLRDDDPSVRIVGTCPPDVLLSVRALFGFK
ncbi:MAG TPA: hypothetical protein VLS89_07055 [Candidatus Nanopelagicales bacterium]|nr:hypothetical protein [Candidatus Nanopelagicales bacterium]